MVLYILLKSSTYISVCLFSQGGSGKQDEQQSQRVEASTYKLLNQFHSWSPKGVSLCLGNAQYSACHRKVISPQIITGLLLAILKNLLQCVELVTVPLPHFKAFWG